MKHTRPPKPITLREARRAAGLTQQELEAISAVDRTRISKLESEDDPRVLHDTYEKLEDALRKAGGLKPSERLVFGQPEGVSA